MSSSRLKQSTSRSRTFLNQQIEYRQVVHQRQDHQPVSREKYESDSRIRRRNTNPTESRLESSLRLEQLPNRGKSKHSLNSSQAGERRADSRFQNLKLIEKINELRVSRAEGKLGLREMMRKTNSLRQNNQSSETQEKPIPQDIKPQSQIQIPRLPANPPKQQSISAKITQIDEKLSSLVSKKLKLVSNETSAHKDLSESVMRLKKTSIDQELHVLMQEIRSLKNSNQYNEVTLLNKKIAFIETILAEQATEGELMKKYYYGLNSNKKKGKIGDFNHVKNKMTEVYKNLHQFQREQKGAKHSSSKHSSPKPLFEETTSKEAYKEPKLSDYESYRYRQKNPALNLQPLPRSSYKRQFLYLKSQPDEKIINRDHSPFNPYSKQAVGSIYVQDYKTLSAEITNHKELDAYQNKYKVLKVNYMPKNRMDSIPINRDPYLRDNETASSRAKTQGIQRLFSAISEQEINFNKQIHKSEAQREFHGEPTFQRSRIKHQQLRDLQYKLKNLYKS